jgi:hypothetical protein
MRKQIARKNLIYKISRSWTKAKKMFDKNSKIRTKGSSIVRSLSNATLDSLDGYLNTLKNMEALKVAAKEAIEKEEATS